MGQLLGLHLVVVEAGQEHAQELRGERLAVDQRRERLADRVARIPVWMSSQAKPRQLEYDGMRSRWRCSKGCLAIQSEVSSTNARTYFSSRVAQVRLGQGPAQTEAVDGRHPLDVAARIPRPVDLAAVVGRLVGTPLKDVVDDLIRITARGAAPCARLGRLGVLFSVVRQEFPQRRRAVSRLLGSLGGLQARLCQIELVEDFGRRQGAKVDGRALRSGAQLGLRGTRAAGRAASPRASPRTRIPLVPRPFGFFMVGTPQINNGVNSRSRSRRGADRILRTIARDRSCARCLGSRPGRWYRAAPCGPFRRASAARNRG